MGISSTLSIAAQALKAQQAAIQTTGHNVANAATPGYSRQRVTLQANSPAFENGLLLGTGVDASEVRSVVDGFSEGWLLDVKSSLGFYTAEQRALSAIEEAFPTNGGLDAALSDFFGALSDLANNPTGMAERSALIGKGTALGTSFQRTRGIVTSIQSNLDDDLQTVISQVNILTEDVAKLNQQIDFSEAGGQPANDARDQRQIRLGELARLTGATVNESGGQIYVTAQNVLLVSGNRAAKLTTSLDANGLSRIQVETPDGTQFDATGLLSGGELGGLLKGRDQLVPDIIDKLDTLAKALVDQFNNQHSLGFDYNGTPGGAFFQPISATSGSAAAVQVASAVAADPKLIAAAQAGSGAPGDNRNATALLNLRSSPVSVLGNTTLEDFFFSTLGDIGAQAQLAQNSVDFQTTLQAQVQARREAASGVNIDEEMTNLILFQRAFEASARLVTTADELYQSLIDMMR